MSGDIVDIADFFPPTIMGAFINPCFRYRVFQYFESPTSLNLCPCKQSRFPVCRLFNSTHNSFNNSKHTVLRHYVKGIETSTANIRLRSKPNNWPGEYSVGAQISLQVSILKHSYAWDRLPTEKQTTAVGPSG